MMEFCFAIPAWLAKGVIAWIGACLVGLLITWWEVTR